MTVAVVSTFFNPSGFSKPRRNCLEFVKRFEQGKPLVVELAFGNEPFSLSDNIPTWRLRSNSVLWQKERLLNYSFSRLWDDYDFILWVDADVHFPAKGLVARAVEALKHFDLIQLFSRSHRMNDQQTERFIATGELPSGPGTPSAGEAIMTRQGIWHKGRDQGLAFGATSAWLKKVGGLFDCGILGGGDHFTLMAALGEGSPRLTPGLDEAYETYRLKAHGAKIGCLPDHVYHLYHGSGVNRRYYDRYNIARRHDFDPATDIKHNGEAWEWGSAKPRLHEEVQEYFLSRKEDE